MSGASPAPKAVAYTTEVTYELWDLESGNIVGGFDSEEEALALVRGHVTAHGEAAVATWELGTEDEHGRSAALAFGDDLLRRARIRHTAAITS